MMEPVALALSRPNANFDVPNASAEIGVEVEIEEPVQEQQSSGLAPVQKDELGILLRAEKEERT